MRVCSLCARARTAGASVVQRECLAALASRPAAHSLEFDGKHNDKHGCERTVVDGVATPAECKRAASAVQRALECSATISLPLDVPVPEDVYGDSGAALLGVLRQRIARNVQQRVPEATVVATLVSCITAERGVLGASGSDDDYTFAPHVDKVNRPRTSAKSVL